METVVKVDVCYVPYTLTIAPVRAGSEYLSVSMHCASVRVSAEWLTESEVMDTIPRFLRMLAV